MRLVIEAGPRQGSEDMAAFINMLLHKYGFHSCLENETRKMDEANILYNARRIESRLEAPILVGVVEFNPTDYLYVDPDYPEDGPLVKGTLIKVGGVVSLLAEGFSPKEILTMHPELGKDDIRACLEYAALQQGGDISVVNHQTPCCQRDARTNQMVGRSNVQVDDDARTSSWATGTDYSRCCGVPYPHEVAGRENEGSGEYLET